MILFLAALSLASGSVADLFREMKITVLFKGVTDESLNDPEFIAIASKKIPSLNERLHEEYDAGKAAQHEMS